MTHSLACALYCNSDGSLNGGGRFLAVAGVVVICAGVVIWVIRTAVAGVKEAMRPRNRWPR